MWTLKWCHRQGPQPPCTAHVGTDRGGRCSVSRPSIFGKRLAEKQILLKPITSVAPWLDVGQGFHRLSPLPARQLHIGTAAAEPLLGRKLPFGQTRAPEAQSELVALWARSDAVGLERHIGNWCRFLMHVVNQTFAVVSKKYIPIGRNEHPWSGCSSWPRRKNWVTLKARVIESKWNSIVLNARSCSQGLNKHCWHKLGAPVLEKLHIVLVTPTCEESFFISRLTSACFLLWNPYASDKSMQHKNLFSSPTHPVGAHTRTHTFFKAPLGAWD